MIFEIIEWFSILFQPEIFIYLILGFAIGIIFGTIPGLTATLAVALLLPLTFGMDPVVALVTIVGIHTAGIYSGGLTGMLINIPGAAGGAVSGKEGYEMTKRGKMAQALGLGAFASMVGGFIGAILLFLLIEPIAELSRAFNTPAQFSLVLMAVAIVAVLYTDSIVKGVITTTLGLMLATIGVDSMEPTTRITFDISELAQGIDLLVAVVGIFAIAEIIRQCEIGGKITSSSADELRQLRRRDFLPDRASIRKAGLKNWVKSPVIGMGSGLLPGAGAAMASLLSYGEAKRSSTNSEEFGKGSIEGLTSAESGNNAMVPGAQVPMLIFGIPGDAVTAIILGVLLIHGLIPGPDLIAEQGATIGPMLAAFAVTPFLVFASIFVLGPVYAKIISLNKAMLYSFISMIAVVGVFAATFSQFQLIMVVAVGIITYLLARNGYPQIPFLMGFILGPFLEDYLRTTLVIYQNDVTVFFTDYISLAFLILTVFFVYALGIKLSGFE